MKTAASILALATATLATSVVGCADTIEPEPKAEVQVVKSALPRDTLPILTPVELDAFQSDQASFAIDLYHAVRKGRTDDLFLSPHSVSTALAMTYAGARGTTKSEMKSALHFSLDDDRLHKAFDYVDLALASRTKTSNPDHAPPRLEIANAIWGQRGMAFAPGFLDTLAQSYGSGVHAVDFKTQAEPARLAINGWVEDRTEKRITDLLPSGGLDDRTRFVLVNAVYFKALWASRFSVQKAPLDFTKLDGSKVPVSAIIDQTYRPYAADADYEAIEIPYTGRETSMLVIAPKPGKFESFESSLTGTKVLDILAGLQERDVVLTLPKAKLAVSTDLSAALTQMGMAAAFGGADFSGITTDEPLRIEKVLHKTFLAVDEAGTEAAAATAVIGSGGSSQVEPPKPIAMTVDRPYLIAILDRATRTVLFFGRILAPKS